MAISLLPQDFMTMLHLRTLRITFVSLASLLMLSCASPEQSAPGAGAAGSGEPEGDAASPFESGVVATDPTTQVDAGAELSLEERADVFCAQRLGAADTCATDTCVDPDDAADAERKACAAALAEDCDDIVHLLNVEFLDAQSRCVDRETRGGRGCFSEALQDVTVTDSHRGLAEAYCGNCLSRIEDRCVTTFFDPESEDTSIIAALILPFGDAMADRIADECTDGRFCAVQMKDCVKQALINVSLPDDTAACLVNQLVDSLRRQPASSADDGSCEGEVF
ncbi:MAG: hypothetical protein HRU17_16410 [Polyangiaceae bacterium]|nr:hypothetical protein [Polyangiaceae bacterium]